MDQTERPTGHDVEISLRLDLLDAQIVDADDLPVGRVDDLELRQDDRTLRIRAVLSGQRHLGPRLGGVTGRLLTSSASRLAQGRDEPDGARLNADDIARWTGMIKLHRSLADLPIAGLERWLASRVVRHIPGAGDEGI